MSKLYSTRYGYWIIIFVVGMILGFVFNSVVRFSWVTGTSMEPTIYGGQLKVIHRAAYMLDDPERGDIIVSTPSLLEYDVMKRVIAVPGDTIDIDEDKVYLNGELLIEDYIREPMVKPEKLLFNELMPDEDIYTYLNRDVLLEENEYFIMGDNRNISLDSRVFGTVSKEEIHGKVSTIPIYMEAIFWLIVIYFISSIPIYIIARRKA